MDLAEGLYPLAKPPGMTSHDVVAAVRRLLAVEHAGHAGTLDPAAAGVLLVLVGARITRLSEYLLELPKTYMAEVRFGQATDTQDYTGRTTLVASSSALRGLDRPNLERGLARFLGEQEQVPPAVSAVRVGGERLYRLARQGATVDVPPRRVFIYALELLDWTPSEEGCAAGPVARLRVVASRGTYVRTLAHDLGAALSVPAHLGFLVRTAVGPFEVGKSSTLEELSAAAKTPAGLDAVRVTPAEALAWLPAARPPDGLLARVRRGNPIDMPRGGPAVEDGGLVRVLDRQGTLVAVCTFNKGQLRPRKVLEPDWGK